MNCDGYQEMVSVLLDNELKDANAKDLFGHLEGCAACRGALRSNVELRSDLKEDVPPQAPGELDDKVLSVIHKIDRRPEPGQRVHLAVWRRTVSMPVPLAAVLAGLLLVAGLGVTSFWSPFRKMQEPQVRIVYITALPTVEVQGYFP